MDRGKLTKAALGALRCLACYPESHWVSTSRLAADGVEASTLRALDASGHINGYKDGKLTYWQINDAGRAALEAQP